MKQGTRKSQWINRHYHLHTKENYGKYWCDVMELSWEESARDLINKSYEGEVSLSLEDHKLPRFPL